VACGAGLIWLANHLDEPDDDLAAAVLERLPRIQCGQCGYPGCRPYAEAILADEADINQCPPGGEATIVSLAQLLGRERKPLDTSRGTASWDRVAIIDESTCIGCNLCARACPVDAIVGAFNWMHTVIPDLCTGCELCVAPCPVDCIAMAPRPRSLIELTKSHA
jgi:electron transport complex protein RnfB